MRKRTLGALGAASAMVVGVMVAAAPGAGASTAKVVPNSQPAWLAHATHLGHASNSAKLSARVYLAPNGGMAALQQQAIAMSTPGNAQYRHFLTAAQYQARYGVTAAAVASVEKWLRSTGLKVTRVPVNRSYIAVTGTVQQAEKAFGASIDLYRHSGQTVRANSAAVRVPSSVGSLVLTVTGLDSSKTLAKPQSTPAPPSPGFRNARPCSVFYGQIAGKYQADFSTKLPKFTDPTTGKKLIEPYDVCGYNGPQMRAAFEGGINSDGTGATVGIVDAYNSPTIAADAEQYAVDNGDGGYAKNQLKLIDAKTYTDIDECDASGWFGEQTLDVEMVHAMAPGAKIRYYGAASCFDSDLLATLQKVVNQDKVQIVSNSWGEPEEDETTGSIAAFEKVFLQGAVEGISFAFSSGDSGDELANTGIRQADYPTSDPYVTSVGGTTTAINGNGQLQFLTGWGTNKWLLSANGKKWVDQGFTSGSGGGTSHLFNKPAYQNGVVPGAARQVPDVAFDGDPNTGFLVGQTQSFPEGVSFDYYRIGGTSVASPQFAGFTALGIAAAGGVGFGLLNPTIYANPKAFMDVTGAGADVGNVRVDYKNLVDSTNGLVYSFSEFNNDSSLTVGTGWDNVTGLGVPNKKWFNLLASGG